MTRTSNPTVNTRREPPFELDTIHEIRKLPDGTPVAKRGALWYITDGQRTALSKGYHEIHTTDNNQQRYVGKLGARKESFIIWSEGTGGVSDDPREKLREAHNERPPVKGLTRREPPFELDTIHETGELSDGTPVAKRGAMWYITDGQRTALSKGYHEIKKSRIPYLYAGRTGAGLGHFRPVSPNDD